jgi:hypothetical protein
MPQGAALAQHVYGARATLGLSTDEPQDDNGAAVSTRGNQSTRLRRASFVVERIEQVGTLAVSNRKGFRVTWKQRRCELRDDGLGDCTLMIFADDGAGDSAKNKKKASGGGASSSSPPPLRVTRSQRTWCASSSAPWCWRARRRWRW